MFAIFRWLAHWHPPINAFRSPLGNDITQGSPYWMSLVFNNNRWPQFEIYTYHSLPQYSVSSKSCWTWRFPTNSKVTSTMGPAWRWTNQHFSRRRNWTFMFQQWRTQELFSRGFNKFSWGQREWGSGGGSPLVRGLEAAVIWYKKFHFI